MGVVEYGEWGEGRMDDYIGVTVGWMEYCSVLDGSRYICVTEILQVGMRAYESVRKSRNRHGKKMCMYSFLTISHNTN